MEEKEKKITMTANPKNTKKNSRKAKQDDGEYNAVFSDIPAASKPSRKRAEQRNEREAREYVEKRRAERALKEKQQKKKQFIAFIKAIAVTLGAAAAVALIWYIHGIWVYKGIFLDNTFINGVSVGKLSVDDAAQLVKQYSGIPNVISLTRPDGEVVTVALTEVDGADNIRSSLEELFKKQDHFKWLQARSRKTEYSFSPDFAYSREKLYEIVDSRIVAEQTPTEPKNARIERTSDGFRIVPELVGTAADAKDIQPLYDYIDGFLDSGTYSINLKKCSFYDQPAVTSDDLRDELKTLNNLSKARFTLDYGFARETLEGRQVLDWISLDAQSPSDGFAVDTDMVESYVESVAKKYDSFGKSRTFTSTTRGVITVEQGEGCYGWLTDYSKTAELLIDLIRKGDSASFEPIYYETSGFSYTGRPEWRTAETDFSDTYCEVDLSAQHFWYYKNGELKYQCDIVSGMPTDAKNTPGGVYKLWYKERDKTLEGSTSEGETWSTFVNYWNNISLFGVGLHDAWWHDYFGGDRYVYAGSHGCVNMPIEAAEYVYENVELDTPVFMYW
ncbi:MAG: L,D-transpeptidase family protein [Ruminococcus sp.]|nr:L,D-transpeptidase family protein [Ruminococcus sp.]